MNKVILVGRTTRDVEVKHGDNESIFARFTLAVDRRFKKLEDEQTADFISCVAFGKIAEFLEKFGKKGVKFIVEGRIQTGSYTNKDGVKVYTSDVVVEHMEFAESKGINIFLEIERINEIALEELGDVLVDTDGMNYYVYDEYKEYIRKL